MHVRSAHMGEPCPDCPTKKANYPAQDAAKNAFKKSREGEVKSKQQWTHVEGTLDSMLLQLCRGDVFVG